MDLFNSALDEPLNWWRTRGLDHFSFGEFVEFLARSPAIKAGVPQVAADEAATLPVVAEEAAAPPVAADEAAAPPVVVDGAVAPPSGGRRSCGIAFSETKEEEEEGFFHPSRPGGRSRDLCWPGGRP